MLALGLTHSRNSYPKPLVPKKQMISEMLAAAVLSEQVPDSS
jgi:hypothetical protein